MTSEPPPRSQTTVVIATRNRRERLLATLGRLDALPERPPVIVVDNASDDGTPEAVRESFPALRVIGAGENLGPSARNLGIEAAETSFVALNDDDSWWARGALVEAERLFQEDRRLALVAARVLVEPDGRLDATSQAMAESPLPADPGQPGPSVLGFLACGAVLRRSAVLEVGGFEERMGIGGEEALLSLELAARGYRQVYAERVVAHHEPERGERPGRLRNVVRNELLVAWLRRPVPSALRRTARLVADHGRSREGVLGAVDALREAQWIARERHAVDPPLERALRTID